MFYVVLCIFWSKNILKIVINFTVMFEVKSCTLTRIGGGSPDINKCKVTCQACYTGVGHVKYYCHQGGAGTLYATCVCVMEDGAPCNVPGCPGNTPPAAVNYNETHFMKYLDVTA